MANHGLEALQKIRKVSATDGSATGQPFDCIIMDLEMPVMDGLTAVKHIRAEEAAGTLAKNQVIALSKSRHWYPQIRSGSQADQAGSWKR